MKKHVYPAVLLSLAGLLALSSCEKAKQLADTGLKKIDELRGKPSTANASVKAAPAKPSKIPKDDGAIAPEWQSQLDRTEDGVVFRKDLPFPIGILSRTTTEEDWDLRVLVKSAIGGAGRPLQGVRSSVEEVSLLSADQFRYHLVSADWAPHVAESAPAGGGSGAGTTPKADKSGSKPPVTAVVAPSGEGANEITGEPPSGSAVSFELVFRKTAKAWEAAKPPTDFRAAYAASQLSDVVGLLPAAHAIAPRPLWFGKRRLKLGTTIPVPEDQLSMLLDGKSLSGSLTLTFEGVEGVAGHPCGRFAVHGNVRRSGLPDSTDQNTSEEMTVESGKVWLSALHPVILKADWKTIVTRQSPGLQLQGKLQKRFVRTWTAVKP